MNPFFAQLYLRRKPELPLVSKLRYYRKSMAAAASSSSSSSSSSHHPDSSSYSGKWEYDVFLCFRGADTRHGFTSHLMAALSRQKIKAFIDDMLEKTESINELLFVLKRSALSIVIFSQNFADSTWCLEEVATIARRMQKFEHRVLPVFYKVDPYDVTDDSGRYAAAIKQKHGGSRSPEDRKRWMDALKAVANFTGHTSQAIKIESELVEAVVKDVLKILVKMSQRVQSDTLIGMNARVSEVQQLLAMNTDDFRIIGLCGVGGVGKTTLAKACYQSFVSSGKEINHHFVQNINEKLEKKSGTEEVVQELYSILLLDDNLNYQNLDISYRRDRLSRLRVFLVLDNVEALWQLEQLLLGDSLTKNLFGPGSRIILTTRNRRVLENAGACIYDVKCLDSHESLQLFGIHAFRQCLPPDAYVDLSGVAVSYCKGNPLAIKVLGGALFRRDKSYWKSFLSELGKFPKPEIHDVLRRSFDMLGIVEKQMFLDTACFLQGNLKSIVISYFSTGFQLDNHVVEDLIGKSLFISASGKDGKMIEVHDLLRKMAWSIVNEESKLEKRTRLENYDDIHKLLAIRKVTTLGCLNIFKAKEKHMNGFEGGRATEGISLDLSKVNEMHLKYYTFEGMTSLRYFSFFCPGNECRPSKIHVPYGGLDTLPDSLRWLRWERFPSKSLPSRFSPKNLVVLHMCHSQTLTRCWEIQRKLVNLVWLDLSYCINLVAVPDLSTSPNLEHLYLRGCKRLVELPSHVQDLGNLIVLDLGDCTSLRGLPSELNSEFLQKVWLSKCPNINRCPEINSGKLEILDLAETPVKVLPSAIQKIKQDGSLFLGSKYITSFPAISSSLNQFRLCHTTIREMDFYDDHHQSYLPSFVRLELVDNPQLKSLSRNIWKMVSRTLLLEDCPLIESLPEIRQPVNGLTELSIRGCRNLKSLPSGIANLKSLQSLSFCGTDIKPLPACIQELYQLSWLDFSFNKRLEFISSNIHALAQLSTLYLTGCLRIQSLPELSPNLLVLGVSGCKSLRALPSNIDRLRLKELYYEDCPKLGSNLPEEIVHNFLNLPMSNQHPQGVLQYSGSEIPEWFTYKSVKYEFDKKKAVKHEHDSCLTVQLPPPDCAIKRLIKGIAFGVVCSSDTKLVSLQMKCDCYSGTTAAASWRSPVFSLSPSQSDNGYIWSEKSLLGETQKGIPQEAEPWYERYAGLTVSFRFSLQPGKTKAGKAEAPKKLKTIKIKRIGVSLLY